MKRFSLANMYLEFMYAFVEVSRNKVNLISHIDNLHAIGIMQEHCTLRLDAGRLTGKTKACVEFVDDWLSQGNTLVYLAKSNVQCSDFKNKLKNKDSKNIFSMSIRTFLGDSCNHFRGVSIKKSDENDDKYSSGVLVVIDEPCHSTEMYKYYEAYLKHLYFSTARQSANNRTFPIFFVLGVQ